MINPLKKKKEKQKEADKLMVQNRDQIAKALEALFAEGYIDRKKLYMENFIRGIVFSAGTVIGATVVITILLWLLSLFDEIPLIGPVFDTTRESIKSGTGSR
jgi:hypothetical protein